MGYRDFWYDEIITLMQIHHFNFSKVGNPPLYYAIIAGWVKIFGFSEFSLRFPSLLFSLACVPVTFLLGKELFNKSAGLYASLIMALSPFQLWYAQEARSYSIMLFFGVLSTYFEFLFINRRQNKFLYWYAVFFILGLYVNPYYIFLVITQFICYFVFLGRKCLAQMCIISLLITFSFIPFLKKFGIGIRPVLILKTWIPAPNWKSFLITIENFNLGYNSHLFTYFIFNILSLILFIAAIWFIKQKMVLRKGFIFCLIFFVLPPLLVFIFSKLFVSVYLDRGLIISTPYYYLILGLGISAFRKKIPKFCIIIFTFLLLLMGIYGFIKDWMPSKFSHHLGVPLKKPVKRIVEFIRENLGRGDIIAFTNDHIALPFIWYNQGKIFFFSPDRYEEKSGSYRFIFSQGSVTPSRMQPRKENSFNIPLHKTNKLEFEKLWVLSGDWQRSGNLNRNSILVKEWLDKNFKLELEREFNGAWVYRYAK